MNKAIKIQKKNYQKRQKKNPETQTDSDSKNDLYK